MSTRRASRESDAVRKSGLLWISVSKKQRDRPLARLNDAWRGGPTYLSLSYLVHKNGHRMSKKRKYNGGDEPGMKT